MPTVLGGGISGLSAAYYLSKRYVDPITLYESSKRLGGWIRTDRYQEKGFVFECGPRTIRPKGPAAANTLQLLEELQLERNIVPIGAKHPAALNRMIYVNGQLCKLPSSLGAALKTIPPFSKPLAVSILGDLIAKRSKRVLDDESIYSFAERRFGEEVAKYAIAPMICGICAGDAKEISVRFLMSDIFDVEQKYGGIIKGMLLRKFLGNSPPKNKYLQEAEKSKLAKRAKDERWSIYSLDGGLELLPKTLAKNIEEKGIEIHTNSDCSRLNFACEKIILTVNGKDIPSNHVISSLPSYKLAELVDHQHPSLASQLREIPFVDVAVVNLQYGAGDLLNEQAFGFLVPPSENVPILGVIFDSCCFDMRNNTVLTVMMGGRWFNHHFGETPTEDQILSSALKQVEKILKIKHRPSNVRVSILRKCIPQYTVGHKARVNSIRSYIETNQLPLHLCGSSYDGVGVNDVILSAKSAAYSIVDDYHH